MNSHIYTVTAITEDGEISRCFGFFFEPKMAQDAVLTNRCDIQECRYKYVVIEKHGWDIHSISEQIQWYNWVGKNSLNDNPGEWVVCDKPQKFERYLNWNGIG